VRAQKKVSKGHPNTPPKVCSVVKDPHQFYLRTNILYHANKYIVTKVNVEEVEESRNYFHPPTLALQGKKSLKGLAFEKRKFNL